MVVAIEFCNHDRTIQMDGVVECQDCHELWRPLRSGERQIIELGVYPHPMPPQSVRKASYIPKSLLETHRWRERRGRPATGRLSFCLRCPTQIYTRRYRLEGDSKSGLYCKACHTQNLLHRRGKVPLESQKPLIWQEFEAICAGNTEIAIIDEVTRLLPYSMRGEVRQEAALQCLEIGFMNLSEPDILIIIEGARRKIRNAGIRQGHQEVSFSSKPYGDDGPELWELIAEEDVEGMCAKQGWRLRRGRR